MKELLRKILRQTGYRVARTAHAGVRYLDHPPRTAFDSALLRVFPSLDRLNFIQVGANDGVRGDPIRRYITACEWSGLLIEPLPALFAELQRNNAGNPRLDFPNAAVADRAGERPLYK